MSRFAPSAPACAMGYWRPDGGVSSFLPEDFRAALLRVRRPLFIVGDAASPAAVCGGTARFGTEEGGPGERPLLACLPACPPERLGDPGFCSDHGARYPYASGAMANGIGSAELVEAMARAGMLGFFGAAGLSPARVEAAIDRLERSLGALPFGFNLIHSPAEPALEEKIVALYLRRRVRLVEASAFLDLTLPLVRYRAAGLRRAPDGGVLAENRVVAKASRVELARKFFSPPPEGMLRELVASRAITAEQAAWAARLPVAQDVTAEADSGGHTDNRPLVTMLPSFLALRDELQARHGYEAPLRVGAAGGISTPAAAAAAFAMGAAYVLTGSVNQACRESGSSDAVRALLAQAGQADVAMAPAADMFEMGVKVQVLKRGTLFAMRAAKLYEVYLAASGIEAIPPAQKLQLERDLFREPLESVWEKTRAFFQERDPSQVERAERDPKHRLALVFRWYLGLASRWANAGEPGRQLDYQVWCGPAMGAFNEWAKGSFLEPPGERRAATVAANLLLGAAYLTRARSLLQQGVALAPELQRFPPMTLPELQTLLDLEA
ncbi:MAG: PfaD family polyunsaturated fatty acid/polyketide biosynthesis protein [Elusimicrobia bacterium]|nr:PfaD family polyunsaturated fatty acid/polyketide biosynthesis protein [Elusimicrobiota bacterium]